MLIATVFSFSYNVFYSFILSSENDFNLEWRKILVFGKDLKVWIMWETVKYLRRLKRSTRLQHLHVKQERFHNSIPDRVKFSLTTCLLNICKYGATSHPDFSKCPQKTKALA